MAPGKRVPSPVVSEDSSRASTPDGVPRDPNYVEAVVEREKPVRAGTEKFPVAKAKRGYVRPSKGKVAKANEAKIIHASLTAAMEVEAVQLGEIPRSVALYGDGERIFRERRAVHTSPVKAAPILPPVRQLPDGELRMCVFATCRMIHVKEHAERFRHICEYGALCSERHNPEHAHLFVHIDGTEGEQHPPDEKGWAAENWRDPKPGPDRAAARYNGSLPMLSCIPRGGKNRPHGGSDKPTELGEMSRALGKHNDAIVLKMSGIDVSWDDAALYDFVRTFAGTALLLDAVVLRSVASLSANSGFGLVTCQSHADARRLLKTLNGRENVVTNVTLEYQDPIQNEVRDRDQYDVLGALMEKNVSGAKRYNQMIRQCGPYYEDAEALMGRMADEGCEANANTYFAMLTCYRDARPPQPGKAENMLKEIRKKLLPLTASAVNMAVDAWCRVGNMHKAEALVTQMEGRQFKSWHGDERDDCWPTPNEETYHVLTDGWERLGLTGDMVGRQRGFNYDEVQKGPRDPGLNGAIGLDKPAPNLLASLARRRAGYSSMNSGMLTSQRDPFNHGFYALRHWRQRT